MHLLSELSHLEMTSKGQQRSRGHHDLISAKICQETKCLVSRRGSKRDWKCDGVLARDATRRVTWLVTRSMTRDGERGAIVYLDAS